MSALTLIAKNRLGTLKLPYLQELKIGLTADHPKQKREGGGESSEKF